MGSLPFKLLNASCRSSVLQSPEFPICDNYFLAWHCICCSLPGVGGEVTALRLFLQDFLNHTESSHNNSITPNATTLHKFITKTCVLKPLFSGDLIIESFQFVHNYSVAPTENCASCKHKQFVLTLVEITSHCCPWLLHSDFLSTRGRIELCMIRGKS